MILSNHLISPRTRRKVCYARAELGEKMFKKLIQIGLFLLLANEVSAGPQSYGKKGTATTTNATVSLPFHPIMFCIRNDDATNGLYFDWFDGVATTADASSNLYLAPGEGQCYTFLSSIGNNNTFDVGVITAAATAAYHFNATRAR